MIATMAQAVLLTGIAVSVSLAFVHHGKRSLINFWTSLGLGGLEVVLLFLSWWA